MTKKDTGQRKEELHDLQSFINYNQSKGLKEKGVLMVSSWPILTLLGFSRTFFSACFKGLFFQNVVRM